ncbi:elongation factor P [Anopheles sinensis]|uniref:Elongation factor P n=1 Tax=Anopheles sinensis TaxID=74873 RepID=A0A084WRB2_ANOSI|nr:elongation factor P [Anopheles sinensis]
MCTAQEVALPGATVTCTPERWTLQSKYLQGGAHSAPVPGSNFLRTSISSSNTGSIEAGERGAAQQGHLRRTPQTLCDNRAEVAFSREVRAHNEVREGDNLLSAPVGSLVSFD